MRSGTAMSDTIVVALNSEMNWLIDSGSIRRTTCGRMIRRRMRPSPMPSERAASRWPAGIASMPVRKVSAK